ncbi:Sperm-associated antigen 6, partial [Globisporangium splendens]
MWKILGRCVPSVLGIWNSLLHEAITSSSQPSTLLSRDKREEVPNGVDVGAAAFRGVPEAVSRPQNIEVMQNAGVMQLLRPLLLDNVPSIQQSAALALGRLANYSDDLAEANRFYKKAAVFVLRAVAKHSPELAQAVVDSGALVPCLEEFDPTVKEAAVWAIGYIGQHTGGLAQHVVDAGAVPLLVLCIQEPEVALKRVAASALGDIAKHSPELAQAVADPGTVAYLAPLIQHPDAKLKRQVCRCLAQIAKHSVDLAEIVVEAEIFPNILYNLKDIDHTVRKNAATCIREIAKHTPELAKLIVNAGGASALVDYVAETMSNNKLPGIMVIGCISAFSETLVLAVVTFKGITPVKNALISEPEDHIKAASAWTLGQIGRHTPDHSRVIAEADVLRHLLACIIHPNSSDDLKTKAKRVLKSILAKCTHLQALQPLLRDAPMKVQKYILKQFAQMLPHDLEARRSFVQNGGLEFLQQLSEAAGGKLTEYILETNSCYPPEIVEYYSPHYSKTLLDKLGEYQPQVR